MLIFESNAEDLL